MEFDELIEAGMTERFAKKYLKRMAVDFQVQEFDKEYTVWAHSKGFSAFFAYVYGINERNCDEYISDYMCYRLYPMNEWESIWIDDKMTMRYVLDDLSFSSILPRYYYYISKNRGTMRLVDHPLKNSSNEKESEIILEILKERKALALKPNNSALSKGFLKLVYEDGSIYLGEERIDAGRLGEIINDLPNYVITEYVCPQKRFELFTKGTPVIKIWTLNSEGRNSEIIGSVIRLTDDVIEYGIPFVPDKSMIYADVDLATGKISSFREIYCNKVQKITEYKRENLDKFKPLDNVNVLYEMAKNVADRLNMIECMEFDFIPSDDGYKLIEINSFFCEIGMQLYRPFSEDTQIGRYFRDKLRRIDGMTKAERIKRSKLKT